MKNGKTNARSGIRQLIMGILFMSTPIIAGTLTESAHAYGAIATAEGTTFVGAYQTITVVTPLTLNTDINIGDVTIKDPNITIIIPGIIDMFNLSPYDAVTTSTTSTIQISARISVTVPDGVIGVSEGHRTPQEAVRAARNDCINKLKAAKMQSSISGISRLYSEDAGSIEYDDTGGMEFASSGGNCQAKKFPASTSDCSLASDDAEKLSCELMSLGFVFSDTCAAGAIYRGFTGSLFTGSFIDGIPGSVATGATPAEAITEVRNALTESSSSIITETACDAKTNTCENNEVLNDGYCTACTGGKQPNGAGDTCVCPAGQIDFVVNNMPLCAPPLPDVTSDYNSAACNNAGWENDYIADTPGNLAQRCLIPFRIAAAPFAPITSTVAMTITVTSFSTCIIRPSQEDSGSNLPNCQDNLFGNVPLVPGVGADSCIIRSHESFGSNLPNCQDLFGTGGSFPQANAFDENERLRVVIMPNAPSSILVPVTCTDDKVSNSDSSACVCPAGQTENDAGICTTQVTMTLTMEPVTMTMTVCPSGQIGRNGTCEACTSGKAPNATGDMCVCPAGQIDDNGNCRAIVATDCTGGTPILDNGACRARIAADCTGATPFLGDDGDCTAECPVVGADADCNCAASESQRTYEGTTYCIGGYGAPTSNVYVETSCLQGGWQVVVDRDSGNRFVECCWAPYIRIDPIPADLLRISLSVSASLNVNIEASEIPSTRQVDNGNSGSYCIMRMQDGFDAADAGLEDVPFCNDPGLFGEDGFPMKPEGFDENTDKLAIARAEEGSNEPNAITFNDAEVARVPVAPAQQSPNTGSTNTGGGGGGGGGGGAGIAIGAVAVIGGLAWLLWDGNPAAFTFSPQHSFSFNNENGYALHYGSRLKFNQDNWHMYWTASQNNRQGDFSQIRYGAGVKYDAGFWAADFNNSAYGENTRMDFALKANAEFGLWTISPQYRGNYAYNENGKEHVSHALLAAGEWRRDRWTLTPSAGLNWNAFDEFGDNVRAKVLIVRDL